MKVLTVDLEDWFHLLDIPAVANPDDWGGFDSRLQRNVDRLLDLFAKHRVTATFFCLGWVAERYPEVVKRIAALGHDIGSHSNRHTLIYRQTRAEFRQDTIRSIATIEDLTGNKVVSYRAPGFSITSESLWAFEVLAELGIVYDSSIFPASRGHGGLPGFEHGTPVRLAVGGHTINEFPMSVTAVAGKKLAFSGGGYFRLLPGPVLASLFARSDYVMTYFHPRDIDPDQPVVPMSAIRRFKSYVGLASCYSKLDDMLARHPFVDMAAAARMVDWESVPVLKIA